MGMGWCCVSQKVNELWAGLGYYRRAMNLLAGARTVVDTMGGRIPNTKAELLKIPGIGEYTAGFDCVPTNPFLDTDEHPLFIAA